MRAAETAATLDIMRKGRLEFGTGRSASAIELEGFGIDPSSTRAQWDEALRMIPKMWTQDEFSWDSPTFKEAYRERDLQELIQRHSVIVGGPQRCSESIAWYDAQGVDMMLFLVQAGNIGHADIVDSLRRFGRQVLPHFRR